PRLPGGPRRRRGEAHPVSREQGSIWERVTAAASALLVLGAVGFMLYEGLAVPDTPPDLEIVPDTVVETASGYLVRFRVHNRGKTTAVSLNVEGELRDAGGTLERSEV